MLAHSLAGDSWSVATEQSGIAHRNGYTNITNINGLDVHIFRFNRTDDAERNSKAEEWIQEKHDALTQAMRYVLINPAHNLGPCIQIHYS